MARGWRRTAPTDELCEVPLADGGTGFVDVLHTVLGGRVNTLWVTGPLNGNRVRASWLVVDTAGGRTAYVEAAQACGLDLMPVRPLDPAEAGTAAAGAATSRGLGELLVGATADPSVTTVVVGLGGSACTDGGAGALAALGAQPLDGSGAALRDGGIALVDCARLAGAPTLRRGVRLVVAADVDNPLLGQQGAAQVFGPQKGADPATVAMLEKGLEQYVAVLAAVVHRDAAELATLPAGGAAGGLGAALQALGGERVSGSGLVRDLSGLDAALDEADLVLTGEGSFDWQSLRGKLITAVASAAAARGLPCLVLAGQVSVGRREAASVGIQDAYSVAEHAGGDAASMADPAGTLASLAEELAGQWSSSP